VKSTDPILFHYLLLLALDKVCVRVKTKLNCVREGVPENENRKGEKLLKIS